MTSMTMPQTADGFSTQTTQRVLDDLSRAAHPDLVFGQPIERDQVVLIPCCEVMVGMGTGGGAGQSAPTEKTAAASGQGSGAGGGVRGRPVATIVIRQGKVEVVPIVDATKVALAALTTAGFMAVWILRLTTAAARVRSEPSASTTTMSRRPSWRKLASAVTR